MATLVPQKQVSFQIKRRNWIILAIVLGMLLFNMIILLGIYIPLKELQKKSSFPKDEFEKLKKEVRSFSEIQENTGAKLFGEMLHLRQSISSVSKELSTFQQMVNSRDMITPDRINLLYQFLGGLEEKVMSSDSILRKQQEGMERLLTAAQSYRKDIVAELIELKAFREEYQKELQLLKQQNKETSRELETLRQLSSTRGENMIEDVQKESRALQERRCSNGMLENGHVQENVTSLVVVPLVGSMGEDGAVEVEMEFQGPTKLLKRGVRTAKKYFKNVVSFFGGKFGFKKNMDESLPPEVFDNSIYLEQFSVEESEPEIEERSVSLVDDQDEKVQEKEQGQGQGKKAEQEAEFVQKLEQLVKVTETLQKGELFQEKMLSFFSYIEARFKEIDSLLTDCPMSLESSGDWLHGLRKDYDALQQSYLSTKKNFDSHHGFAQKPNKLNKQWKKFFSRVRDLGMSLDGYL